MPPPLTPLRSTDTGSNFQVKLWLAAAPEDRASIECNPRIVFKEAIKNATPLLQLRPVMKGGVEYQV